MRKLLRYGAASVLLTVLAGCGSGGGNPSKSTSASAETMSDEQILDIGREYAQCLRDHGLTIGEATVQDGRLNVPFVIPDGQQGTPAAPDIPANCQSIVDRLPEGTLSRAPVPAEDIPKIERFSRCVRENGIPDWPDPRADGTIPLAGTSIDVKSDLYQNAQRACQKYYDGPIEESPE
ncbi:hypothetical protein [Actinophytocola sp.]|uniref:hypothetical protein n=1 Tax=Actinophytocola sp. TaxID=1872138 RepID=UPI002ED79FA6